MQKGKSVTKSHVDQEEVEQMQRLCLERKLAENEEAKSINRGRSTPFSEEIVLEEYLLKFRMPQLDI